VDSVYFYFVARRLKELKGYLNLKIVVDSVYFYFVARRWKGLKGYLNWKIAVDSVLLLFCCTQVERIKRIFKLEDCCGFCFTFILLHAG
jgi:hypothetical protein